MTKPTGLAEPKCEAFFASCFCGRTGRHKVHHCELERCGGQWTGSDGTPNDPPRGRVLPGRNDPDMALLRWLFR